MHHSGERRYRHDRRRPETANDLHLRIEEKRQQIERRRIVRREADRNRSNPDDRTDSADDRPAPAPIAGGTGPSRD
jgi:hypothetical protein